MIYDVDKIMNRYRFAGQGCPLLAGFLFGFWKTLSTSLSRADNETLSTYAESLYGTENAELEQARAFMLVQCFMRQLFPFLIAESPDPYSALFMFAIHGEHLPAVRETADLDALLMFLRANGHEYHQAIQLAKYATQAALRYLTADLNTTNATANRLMGWLAGKAFGEAAAILHYDCQQSETQAALRHQVSEVFEKVSAAK